MSTTSGANAQNTYIDLATFSELEGFLYGGHHAITHFVRGVQKSNWFSFIPVPLRHNGAFDFDQKNVSASINRSGDYVLQVWFRCKMPQLRFSADSLTNATSSLGQQASIRYTSNLMHNLFERVSISFNELTVQEFDSYYLDFYRVFNVCASKRFVYDNMIGERQEYTSSVDAQTMAGDANASLGDDGYLNLVLPFWFCEDSGVALPAAALPYNDIKINYHFRRWQDLVRISQGGVATAVAGAGTSRDATYSDIVDASTGQAPSLSSPETYAHYAVVHNDERVKMGDAPRDILIKQVQTTQRAPFTSLSTRSSFDVRLSHSIIAFFFAARNTTIAGELSNYSTKADTVDVTTGVTEDRPLGAFPIEESHLIYENTVRASMGSDYYGMVAPYLFAESCPLNPEDTGYQMYSYSLRPFAYDPAGSTSYSKLANVAIQHDMSTAAQTETVNITSVAGGALTATATSVSFEHIFVAVNWNIARVSNGSLGHPTL